jgi:hypothetical protein
MISSHNEAPQEDMFAGFGDGGFTANNNNNITYDADTQPNIVDSNQQQ